MTEGTKWLLGKTKCRAEGLHVPMTAWGPRVPLLHVRLVAHSPALIFDFEERCLQSGHWKEECAR